MIESSVSYIHENPGDGPSSFGMYVLPKSAVMALQRIPTHEEAKEMNLLVVWEEWMVTLFVSHTWLSFAHPDNDNNDKLHLLKEFLCRKGEIKPDFTVEMSLGKRLTIPAKDIANIAYVWLDFWSIPQADRNTQALAIQTIPAYVERATFFVCTAGAWVHESGAPRDLGAWSKRGWCRLELLCNGLAPVPKPFIVAQSSTAVSTFSSLGLTARTWVHCPVGLADFSVDADRRILGPVMAKLIDAAVDRKIESGTEEGLRWSRFLTAVRSRLLAGMLPHLRTAHSLLTPCSSCAPPRHRRRGRAGIHGSLVAALRLAEGGRLARLRATHLRCHRGARRRGDEAARRRRARRGRAAEGLRSAFWHEGPDQSDVGCVGRR